MLVSLVMSPRAKQGVVPYGLRTFSAAAFAALLLLLAPANAGAAESEADIAVRLANSGDVEGAVERLNAILVADPLDLEARFLRAKILVLNGRGSEVIGDLRILETLGLSDADRAEVRRLIRIAEGDSGRLSQTAFLELGLGFTDNANNWPAKGKATNPRDGRELTTITPSVYGGSKAYSDTTSHVRLGTSGTLRLDKSGATSGFYALVLSGTRASRTVESQGRTTSVSTGIRHRLGRVTASFRLSFLNADRVNRYGELNFPVTTDVISRSASAGLDYRLGGRGLLGYRISRGRQDHSGLREADNSDAEVLSHGLTWYSRIGSGSFYAVRAIRAKSQARLSTVAAARAASDQDRTALSVIYGAELSDAQRLELGASFRVTAFPSRMIAGSGERKDNTRSISALYAHDLGELPGVGDHLDGWEIQLGAAYRTTSSNQLLAEVNKTTGRLTLRREWSF